MKTTLVSKNRIHPSLGRSAFLLMPLVFACFGLSPRARATCQEGCDTNSNTFLGEDALIANTTGSRNTGTGFQAMLNNTTGLENTAIGHAALYFNTTGSVNTAVGANALQDNTTGNGNTAIGDSVLLENTTGRDNTAIGIATLSNSNGSSNTAVGFSALGNNTTGSSNIALGNGAGVSLTTGSNNIEIGNIGQPGESKTIRIGKVGTQSKTFIAGISGATVAGGVGVIVGSNGQLGTVVSSERFKEEIKAMDTTSEAILGLKPVTFRYKHELDPDGIPQFGLVAEQVEKVNPDLVARDGEGKPYTVRYEAVNAMLLNEFLKEHRKNEAQELRIGQQDAMIARQQKQIEVLTAGLQKVSAQLELSKSGPQTVLNNQ
jgi:hypothetical protein